MPLSRDRLLLLSMPIAMGLAAAVAAAPPSSADLSARVARNVVRYPGRPRVAVPAAAIYVGADRFVLKQLSDCEMHIFVEADGDRRVRRFYWVHFESTLPSRPEDRMHYGDTDRPVRLWGRRIWLSA